MAQKPKYRPPPMLEGAYPQLPEPFAVVGKHALYSHHQMYNYTIAYRKEIKRLAGWLANIHDAATLDDEQLRDLAARALDGDWPS